MYGKSMGFCNYDRFGCEPVKAGHRSVRTGGPSPDVYRGWCGVQRV